MFNRMEFFSPTTLFLAWIRDYAAGRRVIDIGAGNLNLIERLANEVNVPAVGTEPYVDMSELAHRGLFNRVFPADVADVKIVRTHPHLLIVARPSHGGWVEEIPTYMHDDSELVYIGLTKNVDEDLYELEYKDLTHEAPATDSHEVVLSLRKQ